MKWISVEDKLPSKTDKSHVLIYRPDSSELQGSKTQIVPSSMVRIMTDSTHWTPLPEPPEIK